MINKEMARLGNERSVIRKIFEYGNRLKEKIGPQNVFDFSLGNPSIEPPSEITECLARLINEENPTALHGYTSAAGAPATRRAVANSINRRFSVGISENEIYMTCGAAASLTITLKALLNEGDEVILCAPYFPEYKVFAEASGARTVVIEPNRELGISAEALKKAINKKTKAVIINSPNNPSGRVISDSELEGICGILKSKQEELNTEIFIIADEPYRELVYGAGVPYVMNYYDNTLVCYSYSKSLSLAGERIGYIAVNPKARDSKEIYAAVCGAGRSLGFVCAPSLFQRLVAECGDALCDVESYRKNRDLLYDSLVEYGYECVKPEGAFYLFIKAPGGDANEFCERAKEKALLLVPSDSFGVKGYVRISYCVPHAQIQSALPKFRELI